MSRKEEMLVVQGNQSKVWSPHEGAKGHCPDWLSWLEQVPGKKSCGIKMEFRGPDGDQAKC